MTIEEINLLRSCSGDEECFRKLEQYIKKEKRFRYLSNMSADGVIISQNTVIVDANSAVLALYGYTFNELRGRTLLDFATPESAQIAIHHIQTESNGPYQLTAVHKDGSRFQIEVVEKDIEYDGEHYCILTIRDITERNKIQGELEGSKSDTAAILEITSDSIWTLDSNRCLVMFNSGYSNRLNKAFGIQLIKGMKLHDFLPKEISEVSHPFYNRALAGENVAYEFTYKDRDDRDVYVEVMLNPIITGERVTGVIGVGRDITERKRNEDALRSSQSNLMAIFENTDSGIWSIDPEFRLLTFNIAYDEIFFQRFGRHLELGVPLFDFVPEATASLWKPMYARAFKGERFSFEFTYIQDGEQKFTEVALNPIYSGEIITSVTAFGRDVTERKINEEALKRSQVAIRGLIENTKDSIWSIDRDYCLLTYNSVFEQNFFEENGIYPAIGISIKDIIPKESLSYWLPIYYRALNGEHFTIENETGDKGDPSYTEVTLNPFITEGEIRGVAAFSRDISERKRSDLALKVSKANITDVIENTSDLIWSFDREYQIITFNTNYAEYLYHAYAIHASPGIIAFKVGSSLENDYWKDKYSRALNGEKYSFDLKYEINDKKHYVELSLNPIITEGIVTGVVALGRDITERKRHELDLRKSQSNIMALIENTTASFWSINRQYCLLTINTVYSDNYYNEFGVRLNVGDSNLDAMPRETAAYWEALYERCFNGEHICFDRHSGKSTTTEMYYQETTLHPIITDGIITGAACSSRDITDRRRTEERLREHSALLDIANEAVIVRDLNTRITFWNKAAEKMYGWTGGESIGRSINDLIYNAETIERFNQAWDELLFSGQWSGELIEHNRNGEEVISYCRWTLVFDSKGKPKSVLAINNDITEQKSVQQQLYRSQRMESLGTLAGGIAHDLNNVLTPIILAVEILRLKFPEEKNSRILETIEVSAKRGSDIVRQVLMFASGVGGDRKPLSLADSILEIGMIVRKTFSKSIELLVSISDSVQPILGDSTQIQQVLMNLCVNARDAMPQGGELSMELDSRIPTSEIFSTTPEAKSMEYTVLTIKDSGSGIPPKILDTIFDPFFTTKEIGSGTGLGLSTVNAIVKSHKGFIKVFNNPDKGASFEIWLPAFQEKIHEVITHEPSATIISGKGKTILIVDDEELILQLISYSIENFGFTILTASSGVKALLIFEENPQIDLVITDVNMPGLDGPALIAELINLKPSLKFIVMTGLPINTRMEEMKSIGVSSFLSKPFKTHILLKAIENAFNHEVSTTI